MRHPVLNNRAFFLAYILIWSVIFIIRMSILHFYFQIEFLTAFVESIIIAILQSVLGLAVWYPVRFNPVVKKNYLNPVVNITATGIVTVIIWYASYNFILRLLFSNNEAFLSFLESSAPGRIIIDSLIYLVIVLGYSIIIYSQNLKQKINEEANLKTLIREAELNLLKSQINPHFLFNSLNSISMLIKKDPLKAREMIIKLSDFLRYSLRYNDDENSSLGEELSNIERYLDIEKIRFGDKLIFQATVEDNLTDWPIPNMILQPLFENAVKHGVYESIDPVKIEFSVQRNHDHLEISLANGFDKEMTGSRGEGIGLKNIQERLRLLYGRDDLFHFESKEGIFHVRLKIYHKT